MLEGTISTGRALALDMLPLPIARGDIIAAGVMAVVGVTGKGPTANFCSERFTRQCFKPKFRNLKSSSSSSSSSSSVHWDGVAAKRPMELICSVSPIANDRDSRARRRGRRRFQISEFGFKRATHKFCNCAYRKPSLRQSDITFRPEVHLGAVTY